MSYPQPKTPFQTDKSDKISSWQDVYHNYQNITNLVNRQCQVIRDQRLKPLPKIREQQYQVEWEEEVKLVMGENNMSYLLDDKVLYGDYSNCNIDKNIIQLQDSRFCYWK